MRRSMNGTRVAGPASASRHGISSMTRRSTLAEEQNGKSGSANGNDNGGGDDGPGGRGAGPVTARLKMLEKRYSQVLEMQAKFSILDKWLQQQFGVKIFPSSKVNMEAFSENNPEDQENPFYGVYLVIQRLKFLEDKVKKLEAKTSEDAGELKPTSNYCSAHAFRNLRGGKAGGGVKRSYGSNTPTSTPKKSKMMPRPVQTPTTYPFKPSVKILPKELTSVVKKETEDSESTAPASSSAASTPTKAKEVVDKAASNVDDKKEKAVDGETEIKKEEPGETSNKEMETESEQMETEQTPEAETETKKSSDEKAPEDEQAQSQEGGGDDDTAPEIIAEQATQVVKEEGEDFESGMTTPNDDAASPEEIPVLEDATAMQDDSMEMMASDQSDGEMDVEQKPDIGQEEEGGGGDISGSEVSASSFGSSSNSKPRLWVSTRRQAAAAAAAADKLTPEEEKPVMYTTRGRRHTVPRRYAEFTGHDNVVSILKSQQRAEKSAAASASKAGRKSAAAKAASQAQDSPPKIKKMVKTVKTPSPKKVAAAMHFQLDSDDGDGVPMPGTSKKKSGIPSERPACVEALVQRVMAREMDSDGMVVLSESYPNIFVNRQQLLNVVVRSNGKATRLTRKMTTLVFEDSLLASASPFGTKYYKDRLPPEPLEAMVDFIAESGFEPHYTKKKIYMIVGQVCNEARAGRVSKKYVTPIEGIPAAAGSSQQSVQSEEPESPDPDLPAAPEDTPSSQSQSQ